MEYFTCLSSIEATGDLQKCHWWLNRCKMTLRQCQESDNNVTMIKSNLFFFFAAILKAEIITVDIIKGK